MYLYGKNSVLERLKANPKSIRKIYLQHNFNSTDIFNALRSRHIPIKRVSERELTKIKHADRLQGIVAEVDKFEYIDFEHLLSDAKSKKISLVFLDNINDPHNLGSIIRILACFGGFAVCLAKHSSCEVTDSVMHVAQGGENFVPVSIVNNISQAIIKAKEEGFFAVGTVVQGGENINKVDLPIPLCLVFGSEGKGIRYGVDKHLDMKVSIPMKGVPLSFNIAMACAIFCHEISKRRNPD